jgi:hypothetical protein
MQKNGQYQSWAGGLAGLVMYLWPVHCTCHLKNVLNKAIKIQKNKPLDRDFVTKNKDRRLAM